MNDNKELMGTELELMLTDPLGEVTNRAEDVFSHHRRTNLLVPETSYAVVEVNSPPAHDLASLDANLREQLILLRDISEELGIAEIPLSEIGPGDKPRQIESTGRYEVYNVMIGLDALPFERAICGTHIHFDRKEDRLAEQYNLFTSMDPLFALLSNTSFLRGKNTLNCSRVNAYRNVIFKNMPAHGGLQKYVQDVEELDARNLQRWQTLMDKYGDFEGAKEAFSPHNSYWGPLRLKEKTLEVRSLDSTMPSLIIAAAAIYRGVQQYVFDSGLDVAISDTDREYGISNGKIKLPTFQTLTQLESEAIHHGIKSPQIHNYLSYLVNLAEKGLTQEERKYLDPAKQMLGVRRNLANVFYDFATSIDPTVNGRISEQTAHEVNRFAHQLYLRDLDLRGEKPSELLSGLLQYSS